MVFNIAEVAPAAPALVEALPPLLILAALLFALGCVVLIDKFVSALFGAVASLFSHIPLVGGLTSSAIHSAEHAISNALGSGISTLERNIAHQFHNLARIVSHMWHVLEQAAVNIYDLAKILSGFATLPNLASLERQLRSLVRGAEHSAEVAITHELARAKAFTRSVAQGIYPRLRAVEHDVTRTIPREIKSARALAREAEDGVARLWKRVHGLEQAVGASAIAAAVAAALAAVGLDWIACRGRSSVNGKSGCGLWNDLEALLGVAFIGAEIASLDELIGVAQTVVTDVTTGIEDLLKV